MLVAISWVRDEADIIAETVTHIAAQVDLVIVMDHGSTDGTRDLLGSLSGPLPLLVLDDDDPKFRQADAMNHLAGLAGENFAADWIIPFDADEFWYLPHDLPDVDVVRLPVHDHVPVIGFHDTLPGWRRIDQSSTKVMFRPGPSRRLVMGNHAVGNAKTEAVGSGWIRHFPNRSPVQVERKIRRGESTYPGYGYGAHWRRMLDELERDGVDCVWRRFVKDETDGLVYDPVQPQSSV